MTQQTIVAKRILTKKFIKGLMEYNLSIEEIQNGDWKYCGGDKGRHLNYFKLTCPEDDLPGWTNECVCSHAIVENCYITDGDNILILGNCCIKKFMPEGLSGRTCSLCDAPHKNRIVDRCNDCREGLCDGCGKTINSNYKKCWQCKNNY